MSASIGIAASCVPVLAAAPPIQPPPCSGHACSATPETVTIIQSPKSPARIRCAGDRRMGGQSIDMPGQGQGPETPRAPHASKVPVSDPASSLRVAGSPQPVLASNSCVCAKCNCGSWRWLSRWSNSLDRPPRRWPMRSSKRRATARMPPRTSRRTGGRSAPGFMPAIARSANTSRPRSASRHRRPVPLPCPLRPSGRLSPNSSAMRLPHWAHSRILAGHRFSSSRTAFRARRSCDGARPHSLIGAS